jgi:hypothetical protein
VPFYYFNIDSLPTFQNNTWRYENANGGNAVKYFYNPNYNQITGKISIGRLYLGVYGYSNTKYTITLNTRGKHSYFSLLQTETFLLFFFFFFC